MGDNSPKTAQKHSGHGFGIGLLVGGLAGIAAYYLMGTKEGNRLRQKVIDEFEQAKTEIPQELEAILAENQAPTTSPSPAQSTTPTSSSNMDQGFLHALGQSLKSLKPEPSQKEPMPEEESTKDTKRFFTKSGKKLN